MVEAGNVITVTGFKTDPLLSYLERRYNTGRITEFMFRDVSYRSFEIDSFFAVELLYMINEILDPTIKTRKVYTGDRITLANLSQLLVENTWLHSLENHITNQTKHSYLDKFNVQFKDYQMDFIENVYFTEKQRMSLHGYLLAFEPGLGKTLTGLATMEDSNKQYTIIVCPKNTIHNVWENEINSKYKTKQSIWSIDSSEPLTSKYKFYIVNYESMNKLIPILGELRKKSGGLIVDETHNFKDDDASRTRVLYTVVDNANISDILLMSGTPIKAMGKEMIPILKLLDPTRFTPEVEERFKHIFGKSAQIATDVMAHRLGKVMHRKRKVDVLQLPEKTIAELKIKIPNGNKYTLENVKELVVKFRKERLEYYSKNYKKYEEMYTRTLEVFKKSLITKEDIKEFENYLDDVDHVIRYGYDTEEDRLVVKRVNVYEKTKIIPYLKGQDKKDFMASRAVVKYVELKVLGEILGRLLNNLRADMFKEMIQHSGIDIIVKEAAKKTICFSTYVDVVDSAAEYFISKKMRPAIVKGSLSNELDATLTLFKNDPKINPLIATIQKLSTGSTLTEANTVIFLNTPWRSVDLVQAMDRVHRIGQDTDVFVYKCLLDTGTKDNLSDRMESILQWSQEMFSTIVDNDIISDGDLKEGFITGDFSNFINSVDGLLNKIKNIF